MKLRRKLKVFLALLILSSALTLIHAAVEPMYRIGYRSGVKKETLAKINDASKLPGFSVNPGVYLIGTSKVGLNSDGFVSLIDDLVKGGYFWVAYRNSGIEMFQRKIEEDKETISIKDEGRQSSYADHPGGTNMTTELKLSFIYHKTTRKIEFKAELGNSRHYGGE